MKNEQDNMERLQDLYREKNEHLEKFLELVTPFEFYREIFPVGSFERKGHFEDAKGNGIAVTVPPKAAGIALEIKEEGKAKRYTITDELSELSEVYDTDFTIMSPISYFGRQRCGKNARYLYALVFDLDGVGMPQLRDTLHQMNNDILPQATFVVNSGTGLHLYYVLKEPIPMYPHNQKCLKELKYSLTRQIWNRYTSTIKEPQVQGILQGFRVVGSGSKLGREYPVTAYRLGGRVTRSCWSLYRTVTGSSSGSWSLCGRGGSRWPRRRRSTRTGMSGGSSKRSAGAVGRSSGISMTGGYTVFLTRSGSAIVSTAL